MTLPMARDPQAERVASLVTHRHADVGEVRLHYVEAGEGPLVVLLHGFPEFWWAWRHQIPALVDAGFRVVAPDMRGYNLSDKPQGVRSYFVEKLAADVAGLIEACGESRASVVGHDWGGGVAWAFAMYHPEKLARLAILNCPHLDTMTVALATNPRQLRRSWYMFYFQMPRIPEESIRAKDFAVLRATLRDDPVRPGAFTPADIERYVEAAAQPGALTAAINYYRALTRRSPLALRRTFRPIVAPTLVIWGQQDRHLGPEVAEPDRMWVHDCRVARIPEASHWVQADAPERVSELLVEHLSPVRAEDAGQAP
jgi:epoxide hydrolase 4